jgi:hypothetical protein
VIAYFNLSDNENPIHALKHELALAANRIPRIRRDPLAREKDSYQPKLVIVIVNKTTSYLASLRTGTNTIALSQRTPNTSKRLFACYGTLAFRQAVSDRETISQNIYVILADFIIIDRTRPHAMVIQTLSEMIQQSYEY